MGLPPKNDKDKCTDVEEVGQNSPVGPFRLRVFRNIVIHSIKPVIKVLPHIFWAYPKRIPCLQKARIYYLGIMNQSKKDVESMVCYYFQVC